MTTLARFGHHEDPAADFCEEIDEIEALAFDRRCGADPVPDLEDRIRAAMAFPCPQGWEVVLAKEALRELEAEFCRRDVFARRRALARLERMEREFGGSAWLG